MASRKTMLEYKKGSFPRLPMLPDRSHRAGGLSTNGALAYCQNADLPKSQTVMLSRCPP
jgi:hypothetical protein